MSEYQYYEFLAVDRPLDQDEQAQVRALSTRAQITATSFTNEYEWGDFRGDPVQLMERYYDAHLYLANWGTHRVMLRLPHSLLSLDVAEHYCVGEQVTAWTSGGHLVLDLTSEAEDEDEDLEHSLSPIIGVRAELAAGDLRPLYLAWLSLTEHGNATRTPSTTRTKRSSNRPSRTGSALSRRRSGRSPTSCAWTPICWRWRRRPARRRPPHRTTLPRSRPGSPPFRSPRRTRCSCAWPRTRRPRCGRACYAASAGRRRSWKRPAGRSPPCWTPPPYAVRNASARSATGGQGKKRKR
ncbi:hypothetical protein ABT294_22145 [Nonomuraea sp. NPDC000554]|uniref:hypothetical protein n=1 Tax=Nonomuraea sp. NPDC000554 TaxID=3154259 RepID=UPI003317CFF1